MPQSSGNSRGKQSALASECASDASEDEFPAISFDDISTASSDREDFLLVLVSSTSGSTTQVKNQKRALTIVEACGVQPEVLDASDPANAMVRDELCEMSGIKGIYPQFFLVQGDRTSFFADFAELEHMNDEGTLAEWLGMELPIAKQSLSARKKRLEADQNSPGNAESDLECDEKSATSSATEDLFNVAQVSKAMGSSSVSTANDSQNNMILSIPTDRTGQEEWSDPMLLERYEDEILALEDYLQEQEEQEEESDQFQNGYQRGEERTGNHLNTNNHETPVRLRRPAADEHHSALNRKEIRPLAKGKLEPFLSVSSVATTATISQTSSASPERSIDNYPSNDAPADYSSSSRVSPHSQASSQKNIPCNVSMETTSTRSETDQLLRAEIERLQLRCEELTAERYIMEGQLKEARQKNNEGEQQPEQNPGKIHKFQLQQTLRCPQCNKVFKSNPSSIGAPISSNSCGHSICRNCCHKRLAKAARRRREEDNMSSSERLRSTISSDLFMCVDMNQVYTGSFEEQQESEAESCPMCHAAKAFRHGKMHVNISLCMVLKLLDA
mmetsp:Transcript_21248/g.59093  ORF Transcript_21248/g.59093 Transcript_21248/m.59093 type:complete len:559 (-) Transcript_21248:2505-4181(-)|eukprot:CAMPEP_0172370224 /NCGR_PEP_ID=MMETSP1060-20121228/36868_1 /TAXON_ID=37318 /ORGANISM="Pseudo-nitzschia pungens, Strain cf. cingulata" /LENGTH=558 /DNA_ID=CAMNT_0013095421 /DNA_START=281 /DNA_END=1957 /DNA_ORIENTATION=+